MHESAYQTPEQAGKTPPPDEGIARITATLPAFVAVARLAESLRVPYEPTQVALVVLSARRALEIAGVAR